MNRSTLGKATLALLVFLCCSRVAAAANLTFQWDAPPGGAAAGYILYAGQGDIRTYAFRVSNMGTLTPAHMESVVQAFADSIEELGIEPAELPSRK